MEGLGAEGRNLEDGVSFSGHERNHLFLNRAGRDFVDASGVSALDDPADARAFAWLDFDRDGWLDLAVVNANRPLLQIFHNELSGAIDAPRDVLAFRFAGAHREATPARGKSPRDGYGARVEVTLPDGRLVREHRAGEGFAAQNSATLLVGLGDVSRVPLVTVHWPSGLSQRIEDVPAGSLLRVDEAEGIRVAGPYRVDPSIALPEPPPPRPSGEAPLALVAAHAPAPLNVLTTMATWCEACQSDLPHVQSLRDAFPPEEVRLLGVPVDASDRPDMLEAWRARHRPVYELLVGTVGSAPVEAVRARILARLHREGIPASLVTDRAGNVLHAGWGVPTVSKLRELRAQSSAR